MVADGGQIPWTPATDDLQRSFRFAVTRQATGATEPDLLISASTHLDDAEAFLQVIGWDPQAGAFQFYDRRDGAWFWAGSSWDALEPDSRGQGPFDSHVNGALNMKELKNPWVHWNSMAASIRDDALAHDDPLRHEALWTQRSGAQDFETDMARAGISRWTAARFARLTVNGQLTRMSDFMRQVLETSTINLASSLLSNARLPTAATVDLPVTFFFNADAFDVLGLDIDIDPPSVPGPIYRAALAHFAVALVNKRHRFVGDTQFLFVVPEPAYEDVLVLQALLKQKALSRRIAAALLMVDFSNPVFSARRATLLQYIPDVVDLAHPETFEKEFLDRVSQSPAAHAAGSPEHQVLTNMQLDEHQWEQQCSTRIRTFYKAATAHLTDEQGFQQVFELADSRRREFRKRPLAEFDLTMPVTNISPNAALLEFAVDGSIRSK